MFPINLSRRLEEFLVVWRDEKIDARDHVETDSSVGVVVYVRDDFGDGFEFEEEIYRVGFTVVGEEEGDESETELNEIGRRFGGTLSSEVLFSQL